MASQWKYCVLYWWTCSSGYTSYCHPGTGCWADPPLCSDSSWEAFKTTCMFPQYLVEHTVMTICYWSIMQMFEWTKGLQLSITHNFKDKYKWWAAVELSRRFFFVFIVILFPKEQVIDNNNIIIPYFL